MQFIVLLGLIFALLLVEAQCFRIKRIKAEFPPNSEKRQTRLVLSGTLPSLREVTVCHWINAHSKQLNGSGMHIVSYAHSEAAAELVTGLFQVPSDGYYNHLTLTLKIRNTTTQAGIDANGFYGQWHHACFTWSSGSGHSETYMDGVLLKRSSTPLLTGQEIRGGGILSIGQHQDVYNGQIDTNEAWDGFVSEVHIWDERLTKKHIEDLAQCGKMEGNVLAWMRSPLVAFGGVTFSGTNLCSDYNN